MTNLPEKDRNGTRGVIESGVFELGYYIEGSGKTALVIGSSVYYPRTFSENLRKSLKMVFADHRGFAPKSETVSQDAYDLDQLLADIELVRNELRLGKVIIVGHSAHGYLALEYAKRYSQNVSHAVIICTGPSHGLHMQLAERHWHEAVCPERKAKFTQDMKILESEIAAEPEKRFIHYCVRMSAKAWYDYDFDSRSLWNGVHTNLEMFDYVFGEVFRDIDVAKELSKLEMPILLAMGRFDYQVAPASAWDAYRQHFQDLTVRVFDRSAHSPQLEESEHFDSELLTWLEGKSSATKI